MKVAFLGTGIIGFPMARNAAAAGLEVRAWNRTGSRADPLGDDGVEIAGSPAAAAEGVDVIVTILSDADVVLETMEAVGGTGAGAVWAQMSTIGLEGIEGCERLAAVAGVTLVDAPVIGTRKPAEDGQLVVLAGGPADAVDRCAPLFDAVGGETRRVGDEPGAATRLKVVLNCWLVGLVETLAETIALAEAIDVDPRRFLETISGGGLDSPYAHMKGGMMIERNFEPSFALSLAAKDAALAIDAAEAAGLSLPLIEAVRSQMDRGIAAGHGEKDMAATFHALSLEDE